MRSHELTVHEVVTEVLDAVSVSFDIPADLIDNFTYTPGQFLTLRVPSSQTTSVARCYSLSSSPHVDARPAVTIKRTSGGYASNWLCDNIAPGASVTVLEPSGSFTSGTFDSDLTLCAAGSGITPIMSITKSVLHAGTGQVMLLYANRDRESTIFFERLAVLADQFPGRLLVRHWFEDEQGLPTAAGIAEQLASYVSDRDVYLCGPQGFMSVAQEALNSLGVPQGRVRREEYKSLESNPFLPGAVRAGANPRPASTAVPQARVELDGQTHIVNWPKNQRLLDVLIDLGLDPPYVCRESACGTCVCSVREGKTRMLMNESLIDEELQAGLTLACQTLPESAQLHIAFDQ